MDKKIVGQKLAKLRNKKGLSQKEAAAMIDKSANTIKQYETGLIAPPINVVKRLADFYRVSPDWLLGTESDVISISSLPEDEAKLLAEIDYTLIRLFKLKRKRK